MKILNQIKKDNYKNKNKKLFFFSNHKFYKLIFLLLFIILLLNFTFIHEKIFIYIKSNIKNKKPLLKMHKIRNFKLVNDIPPEKFECIVLDEIKDKIHKSLLSINELYFVNGLIRKYKPKKIIEIGVCSGGTSAVILNAIKDIEGAKLYSFDLEKKHYLQNKIEVGFVVRDYFPEFLNKWKLFTGNTTAAFIELT